MNQEKIVVSTSNWPYSKGCVNLIMREIERGESDTTIIKSFQKGVGNIYPNHFRLSEPDIVLIYWSLLKHHKTSILNKLNLVKKLVTFQGQYILEVDIEKTQIPNFKGKIQLPLIAAAMLYQAPTHEIAYMQCKLKLSKEAIDQINIENHMGSNKFSLVFREYYEQYSPILAIGNIYINLITNENTYTWNEDICKIYQDNPEEVTKYFDWMSQWFAENVKNVSNSREETRAAEITSLNQDAKILCQMIEKVYNTDSEDLAKEKKRQLLFGYVEHLLEYIKAIVRTEEGENVNEKQTSEFFLTFIDSLLDKKNKGEKQLNQTVPLQVFSSQSDAFFTIESPEGSPEKNAASPQTGHTSTSNSESSIVARASGP